MNCKWRKRPEMADVSCYAPQEDKSRRTRSETYGLFSANHLPLWLDHAREHVIIVVILVLVSRLKHLLNLLLRIQRHLGCLAHERRLVLHSPDVLRPLIRRSIVIGSRYFFGFVGSGLEGMGGRFVGNGGFVFFSEREVRRVRRVRRKGRRDPSRER
jgi:hypothetical protein